MKWISKQICPNKITDILVNEYICSNVFEYIGISEYLSPLFWTNFTIFTHFGNFGLFWTILNNYTLQTAHVKLYTADCSMYTTLPLHTAHTSLLPGPGPSSPCPPACPPVTVRTATGGRVTLRDSTPAYFLPQVSHEQAESEKPIGNIRCSLMLACCSLSLKQFITVNTVVLFTTACAQWKLHHFTF